MYTAFSNGLRRIRFALYDGKRYVAHFSTMGIAADHVAQCQKPELLDRKTGSRYWWDTNARGWYPLTTRDTPTFRRIQTAVRRDRPARGSS